MTLTTSRVRAVLAAAMAVVTVACGPAAAAAPGGRAPAPAQHRILFGVNAGSAEELATRERETGRSLTAVRVFRRWGQPLADAFVRDGADRHVFLLSVKSRQKDGSVVRWADIDAARRGDVLDGQIRRQAGELKSLGRTVYFAFNHEPDGSSSAGMGTPREFAAAWRRVVAVYREEGAHNVRFVWTLTDAAFGRDAARYYPGDAYVNDIGVDAYNWGECRGRDESWQSLAQLIEPHRRFGLRHPGKGLMILESGTVEDPARPGRKARWLSEAAAMFARPEYSQYTAYLHWDDRYTRRPGDFKCEWDYRSSDTATRAWREMAAQPVLSAGVPCAPAGCGAGHRPAQGRAGWLLPAAGGGALLAAAVLAGSVLWVRRRRPGGGR
jgi:hypothetical protein